MPELEPVTGHYIAIDGTRTYFDECGEGTPIVCVHTAGSDSREYMYMLPLLAEQGFRAIALDLPGHSRSYPVDWEPTRTIHEHAEFVHRFAQEVCEGKPVMIGCSIGGDVAVDLAAHRSGDYLAIIAMEGAAWTPSFPSPAELERPSWSPSWRDVMERAAIAALNRGCPPAKVEELRWQHRGAQEAASGDLQGWATHDVRGQLGDVRCPILIVKGDADFWVPAELVQLTAEEIGEQAEVQILDGVGHYPMFEDPERITQLTTEFVRRRVLQPA
jgi:pimeloyl-ACP methyl ester carboxylesterase